MAPARRPRGPVDAPGARTGEHEQQEHEAVEDGGIAAVQDGIGALGSVEHPIGDRHLAREEEGHRPGEQAHQEQQAADQLEDGSDAEKGEERRRAALRGSREAEELLRSMLQEKERRDDSQNGQRIGRPTIESGEYACRTSCAGSRIGKAGPVPSRLYGRAEEVERPLRIFL